MRPMGASFIGTHDGGPLATVKSRTGRVDVGKALSSRVLPFLSFHRCESFFTGRYRFHGFVNRSQCILAGQFRFFNSRLGLFVVGERRGKHVSEHHRQLRRVPLFAPLLLLLYIVPDLRILLGREGKVSKRIARVGVNQNVSPNLEHSAFGLLLGMHAHPERVEGAGASSYLRQCGSWISARRAKSSSTWSSRTLFRMDCVRSLLSLTLQYAGSFTDDLLMKACCACSSSPIARLICSNSRSASQYQLMFAAF
nr:MAG TPA: hypothetical protein [Caudoviricetes sp.]